MESFSFEPVASWWIIALIMGVLTAALWVGPSFTKLTSGQRRKLFFIRLLLICMALIALLRPGIVSKIKQKQTAVLAVMMDYSRSMRLPHRSSGPSRWQAMIDAIEDNEDRINKLRDKNIDVRFYAFGNRLKPLEDVETVPTFPEVPGDSESDIGTALYSIVESVRDQRLLSVILFSDGVQNAADPPIELAQAAKLLEDTQTPLVAVPLGQAAQTDQFADIAIENMADQYSVWVKNDLTVTATLTGRGFANKTVPIQLMVVSPDGTVEIADTIRKTFTKQSESFNVDLTYTPTEPGQYRLLVRAEPQAGEASSNNNELPAFLTVNEGGLRVLYIYGSLNWEVTYLIRSLGAYQDIQLDQLHMDRRQENRWPLDKTSLFSDPSYDVFIFHDVDSRSLFQKGIQEQNLKIIADAVTKGKGLMMIGGYQSFGPGLYHSTPLADILPIEMEFSEKQDFGSALREDLHVSRELHPVPKTGHFITQLGDPDENMAIWAKLPPFVGANRFAGIKDTAGVILESADGIELLVAARVGGRVLAMAADTTYLWWFGGHRDEHKRFWRQVILWLAFKDSMSGDNVRIDLPQRRFQPNIPIRFTAEANSPTNELIMDAQFSGTLVSPKGERSSITVVNGGASQIDRKLLEEPGIYTIEVAAARDGNEFGSAAAEFVVFDNDKEQANPAADPDQLIRLTERTVEYGGKAIEPEDLPRILDELVESSPKMQIEVPLKWQLGDTWYDALLYVLMFTGLLTWEWWLRKKWGLV